MGAKVGCLVGSRSGNLLVLEELETRGKYGDVLYSCICDCGNYHVASAANLSRGSVQSCGCRLYKSRCKDLLGRRFGSLVVIEKLPGPSTKNTHQKWLCQCDCGRTCSSTSNHLISGRKQSCGCKNSFKKERKKIYKSVTGLDVPNGYSVIFLDGDTENQTINNMACVSHAAYNKMLTNEWFSENPDITMAAVITAELTVKANELENSL